MKPKLKIDGVDFTWILGEGGISWSLNDIDTKNSTRSTLTGDMIRKRLCRKRKFSISNCKRMSTAELKQLNDALSPETVTVEILDGAVGGYYVGEFYCSSIEATTQIYEEASDETYWEGTTFSITEL